MKKLALSTVLIASLLAGCSNDDAADSKEVKEQATPAPVEQAETPAETPEAPAEESGVTPEQATEVLTTLEENAKKEENLKEVKVEETDKTINVSVEFDKEATDEEKGLFLLNYQIMLNAAHPDKEIKLDIKQ